jgi:hypothetical protein
VNVDSKGVPSTGSVSSGRIDSTGRYAAFSDTGKNIYQDGASGEIVPQVYLKRLQAEDGSSDLPVYLASKRNGVAGDGRSDEVSPESGLLSRPPVALGVNREGGIYIAFSSWASNLTVIGAPLPESPYLFVSKGDSPPATPTPTPTPTPTATPPDSTGGGEDDNQDEEPGELPEIDLKDGARIEVPPSVEVIRNEGQKGATIIITLPDVRVDPRLFEKLKKKDLAALASKGIRVRYEVEIRKAGSKQRITRVSSRNVVTVRKLEPGKYTVRYRVTATNGKKTIRTRQSPPTGVVIT